MTAKLVQGHRKRKQCSLKRQNYCETPVSIRIFSPEKEPHSRCGVALTSGHSLVCDVNLSGSNRQAPVPGFHPEPCWCHVSDIRSIRRGVTTLVILALFASAFLARDLLLPVVGGLLLALTLRPLARGMQRAGCPAPLAAVLLTLTLTLVLVGAAALSAGAVNTLMADSAQLQIDLKVKLARLMSSVKDVKDATEEVESMARMGEDATREVVLKQPSLLNNAMSTLGRIGATMGVSMVLATFLLASGEMFLIKLIQALPRMSEKKRALTTVYDIERNVSRYLLTITLINFCLGLAVGAFLMAMGLDYPYIWGVLAFTLNFLPYLGGLVGAAMVGAYAIVAFDNIGYALLLPAGYVFLTAIEGQFLTPWLVGRRLEMNGVAVFLAVVLWGWLWGIPGALVAVPLLVVFKVICDNVERLNTIGAFLGGESVKAAPVTPPA